MIDLAPEHLLEIKRILKKLVPESEASIFGSRVSGKPGKFSDVDILLRGRKKHHWRCLEELKDAFSESDLPLQVDVIDWHGTSEEFRALLDGKCEVIQKPEGPP